ncbi:GAF domain-containing protein [Dyella flagellata]|uniref:histidine kinase n=1 Tax=Dyella flagellata TaxID=1867833 RepID=A0ABQ5XFV8_9GAMM|nr:GAF domain-containing protein [Dyella flagellata]GLQ89978.1 hypothetical protein GCM10007898_35530 [Dyella flagellata]
MTPGETRPADQGATAEACSSTPLRKALQDLDQAKAALNASEENLRLKQVCLVAQQEAFQAEMNGARLETSLGILVHAAVRCADDGRRGAFYITNAKGDTLSHVVGMPQSYALAIDGFKISPESLACGLAVATGKPVVTADVLEDQRWQPWQWLAREYDFRGCWSFPVETSAGSLVGSFAFYFREPHQPHARDYELASAITQAAAIIISRHQENEERVRIEQQQTFLLKLSDALRPLSDVNQIQREATRQLGMFLGADRVFYAEVDQAGLAAIDTEYGSGKASSIIGRYRLHDFGQAFCDALHAGLALAIPDIKSSTELTHQEMQAYDTLHVAAQILVPLVKHGRMLALLGVHQQVARDWSPGEMTLVKEVAERTWLTLERTHAQTALSNELAAMQALHELSTIASGCLDVPKVLQAALDVTMTLHDADFGNVQLYEPETNTLRIIVQRGFEPAFLDHYALVDASNPSACGLALAGRKRKIVKDVETDPDYLLSRDVARVAGYRAVQSTPLLSAAGEPLGMLSTHFRAPRSFSEAEQRQTDLVAHEIARVIERTRAQATLRDSEERLRSAADVGRLGLWDWKVTTGEVYWSDEHFRMEGYAVGEVSPSYEAWAARIHPADRSAAEAAVLHAMEARQEYVQEFRVVHPDGSVHWLQGRGRFFYDEHGRPVRMIGANVDTTERREWEERQKVLIAELQHRTRNLMGVVRSMAEKTAHASANLPDFHARFGDRLAALSRVQGLLSRVNDIDRVTFDDLIRTEMAAMEGSPEQVTLSGPPGIRLRSSTVQTLALVLHELATNAVKYGALGQPRGHLAVTWRLESSGCGDRPWLHVDWRESGVNMPPESTIPRRRGQGRELIEHALPYQFNGKTSYVFGVDGVVCNISIPVSNSTPQGETESLEDSLDQQNSGSLGPQNFPWMDK